MNHDLSDWHPKTHFTNYGNSSQSQSRSGGAIVTALGDHSESDTIELQEKKDQPPDLAAYHPGGIISDEKEKSVATFMGSNDIRYIEEVKVFSKNIDINRKRRTEKAGIV